MRELKFRMLTQTTDKILGYVDIYDLLRNGSDVLPDFEEAVLEGVKFEQDTGLKDKNGKEIYEGDIVKYLGDVYEIYFDIVYGWRGKNLRTTYYQTLYDMTINNVDRPQIIGNIHNPELLEGEE